MREAGGEIPPAYSPVVINHPKTQREIRTLLEEGEKYARQRIDENLASIRTTAARLYRKGHLERAEFEQIVSSSSRAKVQTGAGSTSECLINALNALLQHP